MSALTPTSPAATPAVTGAFADLALPTIATSDGSFSYDVTPHDLLTLARSIRKEGKSDLAELAWTYAQRLVAMRTTFDSLAELVTAHSQPINPKWFPDGEFCRPGGRYHGTSSCAHAAERPGNAAIPWTDIESSVRLGVARWAAGHTPNPVPKSVDFAEAGLVARKVAGANPSGFAYVQQDVPWVGNSFVSTPASRAWPPFYVQLRVNGRVVSDDPRYLWPMDLIGPLVATAGALAAGAIYLFGRRP